MPLTKHKKKGMKKSRLAKPAREKIDTRIIHPLSDNSKRPTGFNLCDEHSAVLRADLAKAILDGENLEPAAIGGLPTAKERNTVMSLLQAAGIPCWCVEGEILYGMQDLVKVNAIMVGRGDPIAIAMAEYL